MGVHTLFAFLAVREGCVDAVRDPLAVEVARCAGIAPSVEATLLEAVKDDPLLALYGGMRGYDALLELRTEVPDAAPLLVPLLEGLGGRLGDAIHADLSAAIFAEENQVVPRPQHDTRYLALMRRRAGMTHDQYVDYYRNEHARFGRECPGSTGYHQNYVDGAVSRRAAVACGFGVWDVDSVTEIFIPSAEVFEAATADDPIREEALTDEVRFIDRRSMAGFCMTVVAREGSC